MAYVRTTAPRCAMNFLADLVFTSRFAVFLSLFLSFPDHDSLLPYTAIFQLSTAQGRRVRGNEYEESRKGTKPSGNARTISEGSPNGLGPSWKCDHDNLKLQDCFFFFQIVYFKIFFIAINPAHMKKTTC